MRDRQLQFQKRYSCAGEEAQSDPLNSPVRIDVIAVGGWGGKWQAFASMTTSKNGSQLESISMKGPLFC